MLIRTTTPGEQDGMTQTFDTFTQIDKEMEPIQQADDAGYFQHAHPEHFQFEPDLGELKLVAPARLKQQVKLVHIAGQVSSTPQNIQVPDDCTFIRFETSGRLWVSNSNAVVASATQTVAAAQSAFSLAVIGNGAAKTFRRPEGLRDFWLSAYPDASEVAICFVSGEVATVLEL